MLNILNCFPVAGSSISLSSSGRILAIGGPGDSEDVGAGWVLLRRSSAPDYKQLGMKLSSSPFIEQGREVLSVLPFFLLMFTLLNLYPFHWS